MRKLLAGLLFAATVCATPAAAAPLPAQRVHDVCAVLPLLAGTYARYTVDREGDVRLDGRLVHDCAPSGVSTTRADDADPFVCEVILKPLHPWYPDPDGVIYISVEGDLWIFWIFVYDCPPYAER